MFNKYIKTQHICISMNELFKWQDRLDQLTDKSEAYDLFNDFLDEAESTLDINPELENELLEALNNPYREDYIPITDLEDLFDEDEEILEDITVKEIKERLQEEKEFVHRTNEAYDRMIGDCEEYRPCEEPLFPVRKDFIKEPEPVTEDYKDPIPYNPYNWTINKK